MHRGLVVGQVQLPLMFIVVLVVWMVGCAGSGVGIRKGLLDENANRYRAPADVIKGELVDELSGAAQRVTITTSGGKRVIERGQADVVQLYMPKRGGYVAVVETVKRPPRFEGELPWALKYYGAEGRLLWTTDLCCVGDSGGTRVLLSDDGGIVVITEEVAFDLPALCIRFRVMTADGREVYREVSGRDPRISPSGKFVVFRVTTGWCLLNTKTGKFYLMPLGPEQQYPMDPEETGEVPYSGRHRGPAYRFIPGKGLVRE